ENAGLDWGRWRKVWPCEPIARTVPVSAPVSRSSASAASAKATPTAASSAPKASGDSAAAGSCASASRRVRSAGGYVVVAAASTRTPSGPHSHSAASMPSALVPEISPRYRPPDTARSTGQRELAAAVQQFELRQHRRHLQA